MSVKRSPSIRTGLLAGDTTLYALKVLNHQLMLETYNHLKLDESCFLCYILKKKKWSNQNQYMVLIDETPVIFPLL